MKTYLKDTLGVKALITDGGHPSYRDLATIYTSAANTDFISRHVYWGHPMSTPYTYTAGTTPKQKTSQISDTYSGGRMEDLVKRRVFGKPFVISEYQTAESNQYGSQFPLIMSAYASLQNWAPIMYNYHEGASKSDSAILTGLFTVNNHPIRYGILPATSLLFHRQDVAEGTRNYYGQIAATDIYNTDKQENFPATWQKGMGFLGKTGIYFADLSPTPAPGTIDSTMLTDAPNNPRVANSGQLSWSTTSDLFKINTSKSQGATGTFNGATVDVSDMSCTITNQSATVVLNSLTNDPISTSKKLLLTTASRARNNGTVLDETTSGIVNPGSGSIKVEQVLGNVIVKSTGRFTVYTLYPSGQRKGVVGCTRTAEGYLNIPLTASNQTLHYEIVEEKIEVENLSKTASDSVSVNNDTACSNGQLSVLYANATNDYVTYTVPNVIALPTGYSYKVYVGVKKGSNRGKFQLSVPNASGTLINLGSVVDLYSATSNFPADYPEIEIGNWSNTTTGNKQFKFTNTATGTTHYLTIDYIRLVPVQN